MEGKKLYKSNTDKKIAGVCGGIGGSARSVVGRGGRGSGGKRGEGGAQQRHHGRADRACGPGVGIKPDPAFFVDKMLVTDGRSPSRNVLERGLLTQKSWIDLLLKQRQKN